MKAAQKLRYVAHYRIFMARRIESYTTSIQTCGPAGSNIENIVFLYEREERKKARALISMARTIEAIVRTI